MSKGVARLGESVRYRDGEWTVVDRYWTGDARSDWQVLKLRGRRSLAAISVAWWEVERPAATAMEGEDT